MVGIMHTNYAELARRNAGLPVQAASLALNHLLCACHCHKVCESQLSGETVRAMWEVGCRSPRAGALLSLVGFWEPC